MDCKMRGTVVKLRKNLVNSDIFILAEMQHVLATVLTYQSCCLRWLIAGFPLGSFLLPEYAVSLLQNNNNQLFLRFIFVVQVTHK